MFDTQSLRFIVGGQTGGQVVSGTSAVNGSWYALVVNSDAVIEELWVNGTNVTAARGLAGVTLMAGMYLFAGLATGSGVSTPNTITRIKLTSGSVIMY
jgi:hypothetical protein